MDRLTVTYTNGNELSFEVQENSVCAEQLDGKPVLRYTGKDNGLYNIPFENIQHAFIDRV